ncbi:MAG: hypothetical protein QOD83_29, partial [Solirubrobacteraceae bacterium]|nr:hypothetical protein [Solirubrobacteraceae bacterium]
MGGKRLVAWTVTVGAMAFSAAGAGVASAAGGASANPAVSADG